LQDELKEAQDKVKALETRKIGVASSARLDQQGHWVEHKQTKPMGHLAQFKRPPGNVLNKTQGAGEQREEAAGNTAKPNSEPPADKSGDIPQSAGVTERTAEGNTVKAVLEPAAGKDEANPQPAEVCGTTTGETVVSNAASEQEAGIAERNAESESSTGRVNQKAISDSDIRALPTCSASTASAGEEEAAQVLTIPI